MTITRHTAADLFLLLLAALICGLAISCFYAILRSLSVVSSACGGAAFPKYQQFVLSAVSKNDKALVIFSDVVICLLFAFGLLVVSFICNSGNFRLLSLASMLFGYFVGTTLLGKLIKRAFLNILFVIKWIFGILTFPVVWLFKRISRIVSHFSNKISKKRNRRLMEKYTAQRLTDIDKIAEFGLIEKYYKEVLK